MAYWFENPTLKALAPLALSTSIKGLTTIFNTPNMFIGSNVLPEGPVSAHRPWIPSDPGVPKSGLYRNG